MSNNFIEPNSENILKKEAIDIDESELAKVQEVNVEYIIIESGTMYKDKLYIPKHLVKHFNGHYIWFRIIGEKAQKLKRD
jgi:hypothetical protein